ncbi:MAG: DNA repair protein RecN [Bdellovibrionales bacterium]
MLQSLTIKNIVLIDALTLDFTQGLTALTGETGAGKSILLDAMGLALGERSDAGLIRAGADAASVTATFACPASARTVLAEQDIDASDELVLRRTVGKDGKSKAFVNDTPVTVTLLKELASHLIEIEGQFGVHALLQRERHRTLLDEFGGHDLTAVRTAHASLQQARTTLAELETNRAAAEREQAWLESSVDELRALAVQDNEEDNLLAQRQTLQSQEKVLQYLQTAWTALSGEQGTEMQISGAQRALQRLAEILPESASTAINALDRAAADVTEAVRIIEAEQQRVLGGTMNLEEVEDRLYKIRAAARKFQTAPANLPALTAEYEAKLALVNNFDAQLQAAMVAEKSALASYTQAATKLTAARQKTAKVFDAAVMNELAPLKLEKAKFVTELAALAEASADGAESVTFTVAMNPGSAMTPIYKTASGGELARLLLALKVVLAKANPVPTLIFDEADTGLGGATASAVGERLSRLAGDIQVIVITHSPQVAAQATSHYKISKLETKGSIATRVVALTVDERREEVARMLSGAAVTDAARAAADELLGSKPAKKKSA